MKNLRNVLMALAVIETPRLLADAYISRGYFAIGGELLLILLIPLVFEFLNSIKTFWEEFNYGKRN